MKERIRERNHQFNCKPNSNLYFYRSGVNLGKEDWWGEIVGGSGLARVIFS